MTASWRQLRRAPGAGEGIPLEADLCVQAVHCEQADAHRHVCRRHGRAGARFGGGRQGGLQALHQLVGGPHQLLADG